MTTHKTEEICFFLRTGYWILFRTGVEIEGGPRGPRPTINIREPSGSGSQTRLMVPWGVLRWIQGGHRTCGILWKFIIHFMQPSEKYAHQPKELMLYNCITECYFYKVWEPEIDKERGRFCPVIIIKPVIISLKQFWMCKILFLQNKAHSTIPHFCMIQVKNVCLYTW